ncbi:hypothetical protein [Actinomadura sp. 21ATH]|uniref:hypothetical protein n=1 Tax=Actinomadura sp. 21ATH TaxID=1735444 RepID=UPI0035C03782
MSFDVALLGIDGIGKSSVAEALAGELRRRGFEVTITSWRAHLRGGRSGRGGEALHAAYDAMFRSVYAACLGPDGESAERLLPRLGEDLAGGDPGRLGDPDADVALDPRHPAAFLAAGLMETAARLIERDFVIAPALARGEVVIQESHGFKNILKMGVYARVLSPGAGPALGEYFSFAHRCLSRWAPPAQSVVLRGDPRLAYSRRLEQRGRIPRGEHAGIGGEPAEASFVELQSGVQAELLAIAAAEGLPCVEMGGGTREENVAEAVRVTLRALAGRNLLPEDMAV